MKESIMADDNNQNEQNDQQRGGGFTIQRIYLKDASFESPNTPAVFNEDWQPEVNINLNTQSQSLGDNHHEVVLKVTVTATQQEKTVFVAEVQQAGIFNINNMSENELHYVLGSFCPGLLFPYVREAISNLVARGGFPHFYLAPIDFEQVYKQHLEQQNQQSPQAEQQSANDEAKS
jgi:preprotein translocase subunit SecB